MRTQLLAVVLSISVFSCYTSAQYTGGPEGWSDKPMTPEELTAAVTQMQANLKQLDESVRSNTDNLTTVVDQQKTMTEQLKSISEQLQQTGTNQAELTKTIQEVSTQLGQIKAKQGDFQSQIAEQINEVNTQLGQISRGVGESTTLRFDNIQDEDTQREFQDLINRSTPKQGKLTVTNKMSTGQYIFINRERHFLTAGTTETFQVGSGTVSTQLPGQKVVNWTIGAPKYQQYVNIVPEYPAPRHSAARVSMRPPVAYEPPTATEPIVTETPTVYWEPIRYVFYR